MSQKRSDILRLTELASSASEDFKVHANALITSLTSMLDSEVLLHNLDCAWNITKAAISSGGKIIICGSDIAFPVVLQAYNDLMHMCDGIKSLVKCVKIDTNSSFLSANILLSQTETVLDVSKDCVWLLGIGDVGETLMSVGRYCHDRAAHIITFTDFPATPLSSFGEVKVKVLPVGEKLRAARTVDMLGLIVRILCKRAKAFSLNSSIH